MMIQKNKYIKYAYFLHLITSIGVPCLILFSIALSILLGKDSAGFVFAILFMIPIAVIAGILSIATVWISIFSKNIYLYILNCFPVGLCALVIIFLKGGFSDPNPMIFIFCQISYILTCFLFKKYCAKKV